MTNLDINKGKIRYNDIGKGTTINSLGYVKNVS